MPRSSPSAGGTVRLWRVFPWDASAVPGEPYSTTSVAPKEKQGGGRFDIPELSAVLYLAETPEHAFAEVLRPFAAQTLSEAHLRARHLPLALCSIDVSAPLYRSLPDLSKAAVLLRYGIEPDVLALPRTRRDRTQDIARALYRRGKKGLRWWSAISGQWHSTVLFLERVPLSTLVFGTPLPADISDPTVRAGAQAAHLRLP